MLILEYSVLTVNPLAKMAWFTHACRS